MTSRRLTPHLLTWLVMSSALILTQPPSQTAWAKAAAESSQAAPKSAETDATIHFPNGEGTYLKCRDIRRRIREFLRVHYSFDTFTEELAFRTYDMFFRLLDPGKMYLLKSDLDEFEASRRHLARQITRGQCRFIYDVYNRLARRMTEHHALLPDLLKKPFVFSIEESIETDRSKIAWAESEQDVKERWRKTLKFVALGMMETNPDFDKTRERLVKRYARFEKNFFERTTDEAHSSFLNAFASSLDPHSSYFKPRDQDDFRIQFALELVGIGAQLTQRDGYTIVDAIIPGGAAARDGRLQKGDKIIAVDPGTGDPVVDVVDMDLSKVVQYIRGKKGTTVTLTLLRKEAGEDINRITLKLVRDVVKLADMEAKSDVLKVENKKVGIIDLPSFYLDYSGSRSKKDDFRSSARDVAREVSKLASQGVDGIILDLRSNGGGDLGECIRMTGLFLEEGPIVQIQDRDRRVSSQSDLSPGALYQGPLALLINKQSASASEIIAGALQDHGRALILGNSRTYGKGTVQNVIDLPGRGDRQSDGALKVTISKFFLPSGRSNQEVGVPADLVIPNVLDVFDFSEAKQDYVLKTSVIRPHSDFHPIRSFAPILEELKKRSSARVEKDDDWKKVFASIEEAKREKDRTLLSLKKETNSEKEKKGPSTEAGKEPGAEQVDETDGEDVDAETGTGDRKVIREGDIELVEAAHILADAIDLVGEKNWLKPTKKQPR